MTGLTTPSDEDFVDNSVDNSVVDAVLGGVARHHTIWTREEEDKFATVVITGNQPEGKEAVKLYSKVSGPQ